MENLFQNPYTSYPISFPGILNARYKQANISLKLLLLILWNKLMDYYINRHNIFLTNTNNLNQKFKTKLNNNKNIASNHSPVVILKTTIRKLKRLVIISKCMFLCLSISYIPNSDQKSEMSTHDYFPSSFWN